MKQMFRASACAFVFLLIAPGARSEDGDCPLVLRPTPEIPATEKLTKAFHQFDQFNAEVRRRVKEGDFLVDLAELALVTREHLLILGLPGNGKTLLAKIYGNNIFEEVEVDVEDEPSAPSPVTTVASTPRGLWARLMEKIGRAPVVPNSTPPQPSPPKTHKEKRLVRSFFSRQLTGETTLSDTHGNVDYRELNLSGRMKRWYDEGFLSRIIVLFDEIFDVRKNAMRNILEGLVDRTHSDGTTVFQGRTWTVFAASNKSIPDVYIENEGRRDPQAVLDRFAFTAHVPSAFELADSYDAVIEDNAPQRNPFPKLMFNDIETVQKMLPQVKIPGHVRKLLASLHNQLKSQLEGLEQRQEEEYKTKRRNGEDPLPPYRPIKVISKRTLGKAGQVLRAIALLDWLRKGQNGPLTVNAEHLRDLEIFYTLNSVGDDSLDSLIADASDIRERNQLQTVRREREIYRKILDDLMRGFNAVLVQNHQTELGAAMEGIATAPPAERDAVLGKLKALFVSTWPTVNPQSPLRQAEMTPMKIAEFALQECVVEWLKQGWGAEAASILDVWVKELSPLPAVQP